MQIAASCFYYDCVTAIPWGVPLLIEEIVPTDIFWLNCRPASYNDFYPSILLHSAFYYSLCDILFVTINRPLYFGHFVIK